MIKGYLLGPYRAVILPLLLIPSWPHTRKQLYDIVQSHRFELACGLVILINMALVVVETDASVGDGETPGKQRILIGNLI